mmetsp:Transcript_33940/g.58644  ORF Transcript_33940/g.58644 Transcript_33940/m.58644 type:complete len:182 (+) Transcript_33940:141-686(+)
MALQRPQPSRRMIQFGCAVFMVLYCLTQQCSAFQHNIYTSGTAHSLSTAKTPRTVMLSTVERAEEPIIGEGMFSEVLEQNRDRLLVVQFSAPYCAPCKKLGQKIQEWKSGQYAGKPVEFVKVNCSSGLNTQLRKALGIQQVPTVHMYQGHEHTKVEDFVCVPKNFDELQEKVDKHLFQLQQ